MDVRLLGGATGKDGSPRVWLSDRDTLVIQGWKTADPERIEIPHRLLSYTEPGTCLTGLEDTGKGTFLLAGSPVTDPRALSTMAIPDHETAVEVPISKEVYPDASVVWRN